MCTIRIDGILVLYTLLCITWGAQLIEYDTQQITTVNQEFKLKLFDSSTPLRSLLVSNEEECINHAAEIGKEPQLSKPTRLSIYRPSSVSEEYQGYLITGYHHITTCSTSFWGNYEGHIILDKICDLKSINKNLLDITLEKYISKVKEHLKDVDAHVETLDDKLYSCNWWQSNVQKETFILKVQKVDLVWAPDSSLIQPLRVKDCIRKSTENQCRLSEDSILIFEPSGSTEVCNLTPVTHMDGVLSIEKSEGSFIISFLSQFNDFSASLNFDSLFERIPLCIDSRNKVIWDSEEGHILEFTTSDKKSPVFDIFLPFNDELKLSEVTWISNLKRKKQVSLMQYRLKRDVNEYNDDIVIETPQELFSYICLTDNCSPDLLYSNKTRRTRSTIWNYPSYQRLQLLEEHSAWGFSEIAAFQNSLSKNQAIDMMINKYLVCQSRLDLRRALMSMDNIYPYVAMSLLDPSVIVYKKINNRAFLRQGRPIPKILLPSPENSTWCNGSLHIYYDDPSTSDIKSSGWLVSEIGRVISFELAGSYCHETRKPEIFLIPTYNSGSYNYLKPQKGNSTKKIISYNKFRFHFLDLVPDNNKNNFLKLESSLSHFTQEEHFKETLSSLARLYDSPNEMTTSFLTTIIRNLILPIIGVLVLFNIISFILSKIGSPSTYSHRVRSF